MKSETKFQIGDRVIVLDHEDVEEEFKLQRGVIKKVMDKAPWVDITFDTDITFREETKRDWTGTRRYVEHEYLYDSPLSKALS